MFTLLIIFISIPECGAVRTGVVDDGSAAKSYTLFGLNKVIDTVASTPRKQCSPAESFDVFMNSITPVKSTFHSFIDNTTPPSDVNSKAGNPHCCCNASGTDHNIESKLEDHFLKKKTEQSQSKHSPHSVSNPKKEKKFRNRSSEQDLIKSRTDPSYVFFKWSTCTSSYTCPL